MNAGVILAAGRGTRMGFPKQLALYKGNTLIDQVNKFVNSYFQKTIVVLGYESELIIDSTDFSNSEILLNENIGNTKVIGKVNQHKVVLQHDLWWRPWSKLCHKHGSMNSDLA